MDRVVCYSSPLADRTLDEEILRLPKAELHLHLEGAFRWETVRDLHPDGAHLPSWPPWYGQADPFADFQNFMDLFHDVLRPCTGQPESIARLTREVLLDLAAQNVRYVELIVSAPFHAWSGLGHTEILQAVALGRSQARATAVIDARLIYGLNRYVPVAELERQLTAAMELVDDGHRLIEGVDLQGDERQGDPADYVAIYRSAAAAGLKLRAHAGELCGPASVAAVVDLLGVEHLSHGVRAVEDPELLERLRARGIWFHVCPTSNIMLHVAAGVADHPLPGLLQGGCRVTLNSDDPLLFGATLVDEYRMVVRDFGLDREALGRLASDGFAASLLPAADQARFRREIRELLFAD